MQILPDSVQTWLQGAKHMARASVHDIRHGNGFRVKSFADLVKKVAHLSFGNSSLELLFRGQSTDHHTSGKLTTLHPSIFRTGSRYFTKNVAKERFGKLQKAEQQICAELGRRATKGSLRVTRYRILQWAIIQHYQICDTPLLDVTHSLRVACSFSKVGHANDDTQLYVLGLPPLGGGITTVADQGIQALRLLSICPPTAHRPHFQEGYLMGEYPELTFEAKDNYLKEEWDFARRLICKFVLPPDNEFWHDDFQALSPECLMPIDDPFLDIANAVKAAI